MGRLFRTAFLVLAAIAQAAAQDVATVEQQAETLRAQLRDVADKQAQLEARAQQLDEALKPENIERSLAGIGTTDATALRDQRRQQLEREKAGVEEQLQSLATSRSRLEASIASAEAEAVRLRAAALSPNNAPARAGAAATSASTGPAARGEKNTRHVRRRAKRARAHRRAPSH
jgi:chromosome segregation ATPase